MPAISVVTVSGSLHAPSKTDALLGAIVSSLGRRLDITVSAVDALDFVGALKRADVASQLQLIETADLLIVASPVYRASYTGLFKHVFDLTGQTALAGTPVLLAATGGSDLHSLVIEHQLRPLFAFFEAATLPVGVYAKDADFTDYVVTSPSLLATIEHAVGVAVPVLSR